MIAVSDRIAEKALRLVHENRVVLVNPFNPAATADVALVAGETGRHRVWADFEGVRCSCKAWRINRPCSHSIAAMIVWASESAAACQLEPAGGGMAARARVAGPSGATPNPPRRSGTPTTERTL
jgi:hypothetical protein